MNRIDFDIIRIIPSNPKIKKEKPKGMYLNISEFFMNTIQGEGVNMGHPSAFLRMKNCTMNCHWCDTKAVWRKGNPYTVIELFELMEKYNLVQKLYDGQHLVLTGGSPLKQQGELSEFINAFIHVYKFKPYIEVENECVLEPSALFASMVDCWNNSPKLMNSGNPDYLRYNEKVLIKMSMYRNSWFKFVVRNNDDWREIETMYLDKNLIKRDQVILMRMAGNRGELEKNREAVVSIAIREHVRYGTREHIELWDKMTGV